MSVCPSEPAPAALRSFPHMLVSIGFDPAPRPVWPVIAQTLPPARLAFRPGAPSLASEDDYASLAIDDDAPSWPDRN